MEKIFKQMKKPSLYTVLSPALLNLYEVNNSIVVVIDVLRATSTMATVLFNGAKEIIPVDSVERCIQLGKELACITAGERDGQIAPGLQYGNSSFEYPRSFVEGKTLVLTTTAPGMAITTCHTCTGSPTPCAAKASAPLSQASTA